LATEEALIQKIVNEYLKDYKTRLLTVFSFIDKYEDNKDKALKLKAKIISSSQFLSDKEKEEFKSILCIEEL